jgi:hypothetical protein
MDVVGHQAPGPDRDPRGLGVLGQERPVEPIVVLAEERRLPAVAPVGDMMRQAGRDNAGETRDDRPLPQPPRRRQLGTCPPYFRQVWD